MAQGAVFWMHSNFLCHILCMRATTKFAAGLAGALVAGLCAIALPAPASAENDYLGYINAIQKAGLLASPYGGDSSGHQFATESSALFTGMYVCRSIKNGQTRSSIIAGLASGEGMLMNDSDAAVIYNAAVNFLC